jgi:hypothetical protein
MPQTPKAVDEMLSSAAGRGVVKLRPVTCLARNIA